MPTPAPSPVKPGTKKIPTWYYVAGAVGLVVVYYLWSKSKASAAASAAATPAPAGSATAPVAAGSYGLSPYLGQQSATTGTAAASTTGVPGSWGGQQWTFQPVNRGDTIPNGVQLFYQPVSGVFSPYSS